MIRFPAESSLVLRVLETISSTEASACTEETPTTNTCCQKWHDKAAARYERAAAPSERSSVPILPQTTPSHAQIEYSPPYKGERGLQVPPATPALAVFCSDTSPLGHRLAACFDQFCEDVPGIPRHTRQRGMICATFLMSSWRPHPHSRPHLRSQMIGRFPPNPLPFPGGHKSNGLPCRCVWPQFLFESLVVGRIYRAACLLHHRSLDWSGMGRACAPGVFT